MSAQDDTNSEGQPAPKSGLNMMGLLVLGLACAATSFASVFFISACAFRGRNSDG